MNYIYINGQYIPSDGPTIMASSRGLRYADGFFESIRVIDGKPVFLENHFKRVQDSAKAYKFDVEPGFSCSRFSNEITALLEKNGISGDARIRVVFWRKASGTYLPSSNEMEYFIEAQPLQNHGFQINEVGIHLDLFPDFKKDLNKLSIYKNIDSRIYIFASIFAKEKGLDDALIQNYKGGIIEATSSNIFLVSNGVLYTPGLEDGPIAGTMRMKIINLALENGIKVYECTLNPQNLLAADELFLTNSIHGVQWVSSYRTKRYFNDMSLKMIDVLNNSVGI